MRESLGTVRLHRWSCDVDGTQVENRSKASGPIPLPEGWMHVAVNVEREGRDRRIEADVCSAECAAAFSRQAVNPDDAVASAAEAE